MTRPDSVLRNSVCFQPVFTLGIPIPQLFD